MDKEFLIFHKTINLTIQKQFDRGILLRVKVAIVHRLTHFYWFREQWDLSLQ